jgi:hypothetical protein
MDLFHKIQSDHYNVHFIDCEWGLIMQIKLADGDDDHEEKGE